MSIADYMATCLMHPEHGYYATRDPFGSGGDFTTAPEISQMFGELVGLSLAQCWLDQGSPNPFVLAEAGPGRGTLMADILRATTLVSGFHAALQIHLIETSPALRDVQRSTLKRDDIVWHDTFDTLPGLPLFLCANEFFDALPIRQVQRADIGWQERRIGVKDGELVLGLNEPASFSQLDDRLEETQKGDIVEFCPAGIAAAETIGQHIVQHGGTALVVDYGDWRSLGDTFQAVQNHQPINVLANPGNADLTAHVDFEAIAMASPSQHSRLTTQGVFLERLGITQRAHALATKLRGAALESHIAAHRRLTAPSEMGTLFKVIAFYPEDRTPPPGLEP